MARAISKVEHFPLWRRSWGALRSNSRGSFLKSVLAVVVEQSSAWLRSHARGCARVHLSTQYRSEISGRRWKRGNLDG